jgi:biotin carboxyl carrier protein
MKLQARVSDESHDIEIKHEDGKLLADVDGRRYELEASQPEPNVYLFKHEGKVYEATVARPSAPGEATHVRIGGSEFDITLIDPKRLRSAGGGIDHGDGLVEIKTAMPGKVVRVLVEAGAEVAKDEGVVVVEAMKMQNELKSPRAGHVKEVRITDGATVAAGDVLVTIE